MKFCHFLYIFKLVLDIIIFIELLISIFDRIEGVLYQYKP